MLPLINRLLYRSRSLRHTLTLLYAAVVLLVVGAFSLFAYMTHRSTLEVHATQVLWENSQRISQVFEDYLAKLDVMLGVAYPAGAAPVTDLSDKAARDALVQRFDQATGLFSAPYNSLYYGNQRGQVIKLDNHGASADLLVRTDLGHRQRYRRDTPAGPWRLASEEDYPNDVRNMPWYLAGHQHAQLTWTTPYLSLLGRELVVARVRGINIDDPQNSAVVAAEIPLKALDDFTQSLRISEHGVALVVEPNGAMIASTDQQSVTGDVFRRFAQDYPVQTPREIYRAISQRVDLGSLRGDASDLFALQLNGKVYNVFVRPLNVGNGLHWIVVTAAPLSDFAGEMNFYLLLLGGGVLLILAGALLLSSCIARWITHDLRRLSNAVRKLGEGGTSIDFTIDRRDEIGQLGTALQQMHADLNTDQLTGLCSRAGLLRQLELAILRRHSGGAGFAVLFLDLNGFKTINDTYGHEAGDQALIEVGERLRDAVRLGDLVARLSGDEFVLVLWRVEDDEVVERVRRQVAEKMREPLQRVQRFSGAQRVLIGTAIGIALCPRDGEDVQTLMKVADQAMYRNKSASKTQGGTPERGAPSTRPTVL